MSPKVPISAALPGTARLVTAYIDIDGIDRGRPGREPTALLRLPVPVGGDLSNLLTDATEPGRGFDAVVSSARDRLSHRPSERARIETALLDIGVLVLAADDRTISLLDIGQLDSTRLAARQSKARFRARAWKEVVADCQHGSRQALQHLLDSGWHVGPVPYGYQLEPASGLPRSAPQRHRLVPTHSVPTSSEGSSRGDNTRAAYRGYPAYEVTVELSRMLGRELVETSGGNIAAGTHPIELGRTLHHALSAYRADDPALKHDQPR